jgi:hypothetical protein
MKVWFVDYEGDTWSLYRTDEDYNDIKEIAKIKGAKAFEFAFIVDGYLNLPAWKDFQPDIFFVNGGMAAGLLISNLQSPTNAIIPLHSIPEERFHGAYLKELQRRERKTHERSA